MGIENTPVIVRLIDFLGEKVPAWMASHPAATAAGVGIGLGARNMRGPASVLEGSLMAEQLGVPGSKYGCAELDSFALRKDYINTKLAFEKTAEGSDWGNMIGGNMMVGLGRETGKSGISAIRQAIGSITDSIKNKFYTEPLRKQILADVVKNDPIVSTFERENRGSSAQAYDTMKRFAPELSTDKHVVTAFLRNAAMSGGPLDYNLIKGVADAETAIHKARSAAAWFPGEF